MHRLALLLGALTCFAGCSRAQVPKPEAVKSAFEKSTMEDYVRHLFVWGPQIKILVGDPKPSPSLPAFREVTVKASAGQASQELLFYVSTDGKKLIQGSVYDIARNPFESDLGKIRSGADPEFGEPGAPVAIAMFSDFQCSYCKEEAKAVRQHFPASFPKEVRVQFKDFPLEAIHPWAKAAAIAGRCVSKQKASAFWDYHDWVFEHQGDITPENLKAKVLEFAKSKQLEPVQLGACLDARATEAEVDRSLAEGRSLGVNSTPTMFVNGRRVVGGVPWPQLKEIVEHEIEYAKTHAEKCCETKLPSPLNR